MTSANDLSVPLTEEELDELDRFLMSPTVSDETMLIDMLDGYLTAIAIGPTTLLFEEWFPGIWGPSEEDMPQFSSMEEAQHIIGLIFRRMNSIITALKNDPDAIEPLFEYVVAEDGEEIFDGEGWAYGFMAGVNLCKPDWGPLIKDEESRQAFFPIFLLGSDELQPELEKHIDSPELRAALTEQLTDSIAKIYRFWLPYRHAQQANAANLRTREAKIGRNDPCPCGSGKKFKKCCGA